MVQNGSETAVTLSQGKGVWVVPAAFTTMHLNFLKWHFNLSVFNEAVRDFIYQLPEYMSNNLSD